MNTASGTSSTKPPSDKDHLKFKDFFEIRPPLKILSFTKSPSLKETLNFLEPNDLT